MRISDYKDIIDGQILSDGDFVTLEYCTSKCTVPFLSFLANVKYVDKMNPKVSCIFVLEELKGLLPQSVKGIVVTDSPKMEFVKLHNYMVIHNKYNAEQLKTRIGENCYIHSLAVIAESNVSIGNNVHIGANTVIKENVKIGDNVIIHENCVIGGKSFNFAKTKNGEMLRMIDFGTVVIEDDVEICPLCHIAGAPLPTDITWLKQGCKLDAMVHIGHGTVVGERTEIPAGAQIAGNCIIGNDAWIGVNATIANRISIGDEGRVSLGSVVTRNVNAGQTVTGNFAVDHQRFITELKEANKKTFRGGV